MHDIGAIASLKVKRVPRGFRSDWLTELAGLPLERRLLPAPAIFQASSYGGPIYGEADESVYKSGRDDEGTGVNTWTGQITGERTYPGDGGDSTTYTESADLSENTISGPAAYPSNTSTVTASVVHIGTDAVSTTEPPPGVGNQDSWIQEDSTGSTVNPLNWVIEDDTGGVIGGQTLHGDTLNITFTATMNAPVALFYEGPALTLRSTYLNVDLNDGVAPDGTLQVTNAATGQVLLSDATFGSNGSSGDNGLLEIALPSSYTAALSLAYTSYYETGPVGPFSTPTDNYGQTASFGWTFQASVTGNDARLAGHDAPVSPGSALTNASAGRSGPALSSPPQAAKPSTAPSNPSALEANPVPAPSGRTLVNDALPKTKSSGAFSVE